MGRVKQYNESEVLDKAMYTFWKNGFEKTSMRELESAMGINQFSIYASFNSKQELYKKALTNYQKKIQKDFLQELEQEDSTLDSVERFLTHFALSIAHGKIPNSCMMVNSTLELELLDRDLRTMVVSFFDKTKSLFVKAISNEINRGTINTERSADECAEYLVGIAQSVSIYSKMKTPRQIRNYIAFAVSLLKS